MTDGSNLNPNTGAVQRLGPLADALLEATLPACVRDAAGRYVAVNPSFADLVGLDASRLAGKTDNALQPADVAHRVAELDALVLEAHGHLDARETILARDGRRAMRACRFPVYDNGEPWAICVVMAPGDDLQLGRQEREKLQASIGQMATSGLAAPAEEVVAEREARAAADAEA
ncbi:MAG TPA: PAS domain-containing protein, partial [Baekduia sp.]|nr:PAS domain-containing protein [Baekduia sp.]